MECLSILENARCQATEWYSHVISSCFLPLVFNFPFKTMRFALQYLRRYSSKPWSHSKANEWINNFNKDKIPQDKLRITFSKSSGPGGQNVNKGIYFKCCALLCFWHVSKLVARWICDLNWIRLHGSQVMQRTSWSSLKLVNWSSLQTRRVPKPTMWMIAITSLYKPSKMLLQCHVIRMKPHLLV